MSLRPGCPLVAAPRCHLSVDWSERVLLGCIEEEDGRFFPGLSWRAATADELALLVSDPSALPDEALARCLCLFKLPQHLQAAWWALAMQAQTAANQHLEGLDGFVREVAKFLDFKGLPVPERAVFDLIASGPGQRSVQWDAEAGRAIGLSFDLAPWLPCPPKKETSSPRLWGGANLGDEAVSLLFVNLTACQLQADLLRKCPDQPAPTTLAELARGFLTHCADYPLVRLRIEPGEGYRAPVGGVLIDACTLDMQGPSVLLMVRQESGPGS